MTDGPEDPDFIDGFPRAASRKDALNYIIEIVNKLKELADKGGYRTLSAVLGAALIEARTQHDELDR